MGRLVDRACKELRRALSPTRFLALTNIGSAAVGFAVGVYVARVLGPSKLGVTAVIAGINTSIVAFIDVRFNDVAARAFYQSDGMQSEQIPGYQAGVLWLAVLGTAILGGAMAGLSALVGNFFVHFFTETAVSTWWLPLGAATLAVNTTAAGMVFLLRFTNAFHVIGILRLVSNVLSALITVVILTLIPDIDGVYLSGFAGALVVLVVTLVVSWRLWTRRVQLPLLQPDWRLAYAQYRRSARMIFYGNLLSYAKLLQRSADVLMVGLFTNDRETGIYKLSRTLVDNGLAVLQDALHQVYYPSFLDALARRATDEFRRLASRLLRTSALITAVLLAGEGLFLPLLIREVFGGVYAGAALPMAILTASFVFIVGFYPWLWAIFTSAGEWRGYTATVFMATAVQYGVALGLFRLVGPSAWAAMTGMLAYYIWLIPVTYWLARSQWGEFLPWGPRPSLATAS